LSSLPFHLSKKTQKKKEEPDDHRRPPSPSDSRPPPRRLPSPTAAARTPSPSAGFARSPANDMQARRRWIENGECEISRRKTVKDWKGGELKRVEERSDSVAEQMWGTSAGMGRWNRTAAGQWAAWESGLAAAEVLRRPFLGGRLGVSF
ncbi:unnamed protein product, partial [Linum tenue]